MRAARGHANRIDAQKQLTAAKSFPYDSRKSTQCGILRVQMPEFGDRFKKARQSQGISLDQIAFETRIGIRFLQAIENEDFHLLPGGIFNRGFIRSYAERVGLDSDQMVGEYERISGHRDPLDLEMASDPALNPAQKGLFPIAIGILALAIIIFYAATRASDPPEIEDERPGLIETPSVPAPADERPLRPESEPVEGMDAEPAAPSQALAVEMEVVEPTWIRLATDGTEIVAGEVLQPGTMRRYTAEASIDITIGNAGGLMLRINDRPVSVLGRSGQVREFNITPQNLDKIFG
jgi:cytoskeletal protein RodZ